VLLTVTVYITLSIFITELSSTELHKNQKGMCGLSHRDDRSHRQHLQTSGKIVWEWQLHPQTSQMWSASFELEALEHIHTHTLLMATFQVKLG